MRQGQGSRPRARDRRLRLHQAGWVTVFVAALLVPCACGSAASPGTDPAPSATTITVPPATSSTSLTPGSPAETSDSVDPTSSSLPGLAPETLADPLIQAAFARSALALAPVPVYAPLELPPGARLAENWIPLIGSEPAREEAGQGASSPSPNPRLSIEPGDPQAEVLVDIPGGALLFLENFRGDLGDIPSNPAGQVAGHPAARYEVEGGVIVQWSDSGRWYAVYGVGEGAAWATVVATKMAVLQP